MFEISIIIVMQFIAILIYMPTISLFALIIFIVGGIQGAWDQVRGGPWEGTVGPWAAAGQESAVEFGLCIGHWQHAEAEDKHVNQCHQAIWHCQESKWNWTGRPKPLIDIRELMWGAVRVGGGSAARERGTDRERFMGSRMLLAASVSVSPGVSLRVSPGGMSPPLHAVRGGGGGEEKTTKHLLPASPVAGGTSSASSGGVEKERDELRKRLNHVLGIGGAAGAPIAS
ncbi:hypothetical protein H2248_010304 [Termitomyces sp. 'cryptogamus']|nr:hypothetical protein H2248_010304 [Termitomyces sp. 'cryptogamus']